MYVKWQLSSDHANPFLVLFGFCAVLTGLLFINSTFPICYI